MLARKSFLERLSNQERDDLAKLAGTSADWLNGLSNSSREGIPLQTPEAQTPAIERALQQEENRLYNIQPINTKPAGGSPRLESKTKSVEPSMYMKAIWELRSRLLKSQSLAAQLKSRVESSEKELDLKKNELRAYRVQTKKNIAQLAKQVEKLTAREQEAEANSFDHNAQVEKLQKELNHSKASEQRLRALLNDQFSLQDKYVKAENQRSKTLDAITTAELLRDSEPPPSFPTSKPVPFTKEEFVRMRQRLGKLDEDHRLLIQKYKDLATQKKDYIKLRVQSKREHESLMRKNQSHLVGAVRRIQWLLYERNRLSEQLSSSKSYVAKLETKLLHLYHTKRRSTKKHVKSRSFSVSPTRQLQQMLSSSVPGEVHKSALDLANEFSEASVVAPGSFQETESNLAKLATFVDNLIDASDETIAAATLDESVLIKLQTQASQIQ